MVSNISKNIELLEQYNAYKIFLDSLGSNAEKEEMRMREDAKRQKLAVKDQKRREAEAHYKKDYSKSMTKSIKGKTGRSTISSDKLSLDNLEAELNIPAALKEIIDDSDEDDQLRFTDHNDLMNIFTTLEEKNLFLIKRCQDSEQQLEEKKQQEKKIMEQFERQIDLLLSNKTTNEDRIGKITTEKDALEDLADDNEKDGLTF